MSCVQMALVYRKSTKSIARKYERSPGMEPNVGGVTHMTVINPGSPRQNPFQWVIGRGKNHRHVSPAYRTMKSARGWAEKHQSPSEARARLVAVDEYGTIVTRPLSRKQVLRNPGSNSMAYNLSALRQAMRRNAAVDSPGRNRVEEEFMRKHRAAKRAAAPASSGGGGPNLAATFAAVTPAQRKRIAKGLSKSALGKHQRAQARKSKRASGAKVKGAKIMASAKKKSKRTATAKGATAAAKSATKQAKVASKASTRAKKATSKKVASKAAKVAGKAATKAKKAAVKAVSKASKAKPASKKAANKAASKAKREAAKAATAAAAAAAAVKKASSRLSRRGRISGRKGSLKLKGSPYRTGRLFNPPYIHVTGFERVARGKKKTSRRISASKRKSGSKRGASKRKGSKRVVRNMLARTGHSRGVPSGRRVQIVEFGPHSRRRGHAVYVPGHVSERAYVRRFKFGGAAKRAHSKAMQFGYSRKRRSRPVTANGRSSMRRNSKRRSKRHSRRMRSNRYVVANRRKRRLRRNVTIFGIDPISQVAIPGAYALGGLVAANAAANMAARVPALTNMLDAGRADPIVTKSLAGALGAGLTLFFGGRLPSLLRNNVTPIVAGMGCAVAVRLLRGNTTMAPYLGSWGAGFGEYVNQPLGAYVQDPSMGEYVDQPLGEYVDQPLGGLGTMYAAAGYPEGVDPADQGSIDGLMDVMEASAGVGAYEAAAGMGTLYAAAGMGADAPATFTPPVGPGGRQQPPFVSIETPIDLADRVTRTMPRDLPIPTSMVTSEGRGSAGGIFSRSIFGGMMS